MTQSLQTRCVKEALARVRDLFMEPGAKLTAADAAQMAGLDRQVCRVLLQNLIEAGFLERRLRIRRSPFGATSRGPRHEYLFRRSIIIMSGSLHPVEVHRRRHREEKRNKLRARIAAAPAGGRAALEAKLLKTYAPGCGPQPLKSGAPDAPVPVPTLKG